ncbi:hypothetical protein [Actinomadura violacea]|uniref:Transmembrane protein n=1 Tax=Actinomadura violacea TaxID=2819934 RepID=A0ABS3RKW0_9ACTN|nr:hypothetical protein [Actinomadura violacea]MBO2457203.1 hypothetical protein [Actinomadura violacea]
MTARLWGLALLLVTLIVNWLAFVVVQTETSGTVAIAHVHDCNSGRGGMCSGTWTDEGGRAGSGEILGAGHSMIGQDARVRLGALGPIAQGAWEMPAGLVSLAVVADAALIVLAWRLRHRRAGRALTPRTRVVR